MYQFKTSKSHLKMSQVELLLNYLRSKQRIFMYPILDMLSLNAREELASCLTDWLETSEIMPPKDTLLAGIYYYCIKKLPPLSNRNNPNL